MTDPCLTSMVAQAADAERLIARLLQDHAPRWGPRGRSVDTCAACGRLPRLTVVEHQARAVRNHLVQTGLLQERSGQGSGPWTAPDSEAVLRAILTDHATRFDEARRPMRSCMTCGPLGAGIGITLHQARMMHDRLLGAGVAGDAFAPGTRP